MTGITSRENYAKLIAESEKLFGEARKQNVMGGRASTRRRALATLRTSNRRASII